MYKINCGVKAQDGIQIEFDDISDFYAFEETRVAKGEEHPITGHIKSIDVAVVYEDIYETGNYEWFVVGGEFLNSWEPLRWHPLEDYIEDASSAKLAPEHER